MPSLNNILQHHASPNALLREPPFKPTEDLRFSTYAVTQHTPAIEKQAETTPEDAGRENKPHSRQNEVKLTDFL
ncbi:hypothetical protein KFK09_021838 [Dendrobium nobile]|uniref:Uncharacterized protein n=1 Tax=Dendrobium nobile TaxID=94219 RepID=A0A8T3AGV0_DENNO|nr:hypothetical protein KFK09_021838 [Dendrobium nobile]